MNNSNAPILADTADEVFEVFQQDLRKDPVPHHGGNLRAPDSALAVHYAREFYGRRQESDRLWIIPRAQFWEINNPQQADIHPLAENGTISTQQDATTFAVFGQPQAGKALEWIGDLPDKITSLELTPDRVQQFAKTNGIHYQRFWLCPRSAILELASPDLLHPPLDRSYRRLDGYNIREKLRAARQRAQQQTAQERPDNQTQGVPPS
jgi:1,2-phenylacetyl-CoA epoxidase PaaB subunit